jgi:hypothetical protein
VDGSRGGQCEFVSMVDVLAQCENTINEFIEATWVSLLHQLKMNQTFWIKSIEALSLDLF